VYIAIVNLQKKT